MSETHVVVVGTGPEARIALDIFAAQNSVVLGILENDEQKEVMEVNDVGVFAKLDSEDSRTVLAGGNVEYFVAIGENDDRKDAYERLASIANKPSINATHPMAVVSPYAKIGFGNLINAGTVINANSTVGDQNIIHSGVVIEPDAVVGNYCHISAGVRVGGNVKIEDEAFIGTGAIIHPGITIGEGALIGAGAVVLKGVEAGQIVHGNPAQPV